MKCPKCGYDNRGNASFCQGCGAALVVQNATGADTALQPTKPLAQSSAPQTYFDEQSDTRPLEGASAAFAPLPEGALLREGRYVVLEVRTTDERSNLYLAEDTIPVSLCPNCRSETTDLEEQYCAYCGADISGLEPLYLRYLILERADEQAFAAEAQLLGMRLEHPNLLFPHDVFAEAPYGVPRQYLVGPEFPPQLATSLAVPSKLNQVLDWGVALAQALSYLHRHQVTLGGAGLEYIAVDGGVAYWAQLGRATVIPPEARSQAADYFAQDIRGLAAALFYLATGKSQYVPQAALPDPVAAIFEQALASAQGFADAEVFGTALEEALQDLRRPASATLIVGHRTDVGQERSLNEDSLLTLDFTPVFRSKSAAVSLFAVADGMGGHEAGDVASQAAIQAIAQLAIRDVMRPAAAGEPLPEFGEWLTDVSQAASKAVYDKRRDAGTDMGTTLVMALFVGDIATIANVGDSRAYLLKPDSIVQVTVDHSLVERLVATGQITPEEAANHPQKNVIYRVIGDKPRVENDIYERRLAPGEALLLCSDGLSGMVSNEEMWQIWRTSTSPQEASDRLVEAANEAGGEDNITVVIVQVAQ
ncbi:MAG: Stp1/IreP family PP2C-type Ser/Thr phosphatase [Anaerolineae bacterium]|jgi:serine/threonine protein phosphatase PrpC